MKSVLQDCIIFLPQTTFCNIHSLYPLCQVNMPLCLWEKGNISWYQRKGFWFLHFTCSIIVWVMYFQGHGCFLSWEGEDVNSKTWEQALALEMFFFFLHSFILSLDWFLAKCLMWPHCLQLMTSLFSSCKLLIAEPSRAMAAFSLGRHSSSHITELCWFFLFLDTFPLWIVLFSK